MSDEPYYETTLLNQDESNFETTLLSEDDSDNEATLSGDNSWETTLLGNSTETSLSGDNSGETTLLGDNSGETTLLSEKKTIPPGVNRAILKNVVSHEEVQITVTPFTVGRKAGEVDYCIPNDSVSRHHMDITLEGTDYYIEDMNSTNGTMLDNTRLSPGKPMKLCDKAYIYIQVAEEYFQFKITGR